MGSIESTDVRPALPVYDCVVLSGGGAKGAYAAGAAKALEVYRDLKGETNPVCFIGASAGALNAYILAAHDADRLISFWRSITKRRILGVAEGPTRRRMLKRVVAKTFRPSMPFSVYDNTALVQLISENVKLKDVKRPLIFAVTNYSRGELEGFYVSPVIQNLVEYDELNAKKRSSRRLGHLHRVESDVQLTAALTASAAIPVYFAPVQITVERDGETVTDWYVDGGVGNNTPTREAAYFFRYLEKMKLGRSGTLYCVNLDPARVFQQGNVPLSLLDIVRRTIEVFQVVHTKPIVEAFSRINREVDSQARKVADTRAWLEGLSMDEEIRRVIGDRIVSEFDKLGGQAPRVSTPIVEIQPTTPLRDFLDFDPDKVDQDIRQGYLDALTVFKNMPDPTSPGDSLLDEVEFRKLANLDLGMEGKSRAALTASSATASRK